MTAIRAAGVPQPFAVFDATSEVLTAIHHPEVSLAVWERAPVAAVETLDGFASIQLTSACNTMGADLGQALRAFRDQPWHAAIARDAASLAGLFGNIMGVSHLDLRLECIVGNACWKVHADHVTARLITTYLGRGTEWFERGTAPDEPVRRGQLATGAVGLFKGRVWSPHDAILHRSPPIAGTGERRLLLVLDPARIA